MGGLFSRLMATLLSKHLELCIVGLENSGKTTLLHTLAGQTSGTFQTVPTIGSDLKQFTAEGISLKAWDIGGQTKFRSGWGRYAQGCDVIIFVVDANDIARLDEARRELGQLLEDETLRRLPLLVVANKIDLEPHVSRDELIRALNLDYITDVPWTAVAISARMRTNLVEVLEWLVKQSKRGSRR